MDIREASTKDLPEINQMIREEKSLYLREKTKEDLSDPKKILVVAETTEETGQKKIIGFGQADLKEAEEQRTKPAGNLIQHTFLAKNERGEIQKRFADFFLLEAKKRRIEYFFVQLLD
ncbi:MULTISPECIES: hypothetical protein [unclassified Enterococcus]|uniref:hypothetical protein n=1 Tax=unclassified Enterococcus TaxID=2608891 RepID=UPI0013EB8368|nr:MULTISPECIES: hypothetical protein [unclassified Enterococcus]